LWTRLRLLAKQQTMLYEQTTEMVGTEMVKLGQERTGRGKGGRVANVGVKKRCW
jgi:hypothetical protein